MTTAQHPLGSGFSSRTTAAEVLRGVRLDGVLAIVTGGAAGIGLETTRALANAGAKVIVPARSLDKARPAVAGIPNVELDVLDLADPKSIDAFTARFLETGRALQLLINNAGIMATPLVRDARGFESQLATNHVGHFQLTRRLWPALVKAKGARIISVSSRGHVRSGFDFADPHFMQRPYDKWLAYGQAKTANVLFAVEADRRGREQRVRAFSLHPGAILTELMRSLSKEEQDAAVARAQQMPVGVKNVEQGAATTVWAATSKQLDGLGGLYCEDCDVAEAVTADDQRGIGVRPWAIDPDAARRLWELTEHWLG